MRHKQIRQQLQTVSRARTVCRCTVVQRTVTKGYTVNHYDVDVLATAVGTMNAMSND